MINDVGVIPCIFFISRIALGDDYMEINMDTINNHIDNIDKTYNSDNTDYTDSNGNTDNFN